MKAPELAERLLMLPKGQMVEVEENGTSFGPKGLRYIVTMQIEGLSQRSVNLLTQGEV